MTITTIDCHYLDHAGYAAAYLIEEGERAAFVETNTSHALPHLLAALEERSLTPEQVDYVIITHVHLDHAGGTSALMDACPNATLLAHPRAAPHMIEPSKLVKSARKVYGDEFFDRVYGSVEPVPEQRVRTMADGETLELGSRTLTFLHTRGHANHHFCIHDSRENAIFTGDSFGLSYPALQDGGIFAIASTTPTDFDAAAAKESLDRILGTGAARAYLTHFGPVDDLAAVAEQLHGQLDQYGAIVDEAFGTDLEGEALDELCEERVRSLFDALYRDRGLGDDDEQARALLENDTDINAQGIAFAVKKRRFKASH